MKLFILFITLLHCALAVARPELPAAGVDFTLTGGKPAAEFFQARAADKVCRAALDKARAEMDAAEAEVFKAKAQGNKKAILGADETFLGKRRAFLEPFSRCGECASQIVKPLPPMQHEGKTEYWYVTDGSCFAPPATTPADSAEVAQRKLHETFLRRSESLLTLRNYPNKSGGFRHIVDFLAVDPKTGDYPEGVTKILPGNFFSFIAVKSPINLGIPVALWYVFRNETQALEAADKEFAIKFFSDAPPSDEFAIPRPLFDVNAANERVDYKALPLGSVMGMWYLADDGYMRYFTAADFGALGKLVDKLAPAEARLILLETLYEFTRRGILRKAT